MAIQCTQAGENIEINKRVSDIRQKQQVWKLFAITGKQKSNENMDTDLKATEIN